MAQITKHYKLGLVIGRFQPFHLGHRYLIQKALESADKIIIGIGSANVTDENNPYSFKNRKNMIGEFIKQEGLEERVSKIIPSDDIPSDDIWLEKVLENAPDVDVVIGNNDWTNGIFEKAGFKVIYVPYYKRELYEGWRIRKLMKEGKDWQNRVPSYIITFL